MPNHLAQAMLSAIVTRQERDGAPEAKARAAQKWAVERAETLPKDIASTNSAFPVKLLALQEQRLREDDLLKIKALGELLGIDLTPREGGARIFDCRLGGDDYDWQFGIMAEDLRKLLAAS